MLKKNFLSKEFLSLHNLVLLIIFVFLIVILYVLNQPRLKSKFFPQHRASLLNNLILTSVENQEIDPQELWMFREFYYPGTIILYENNSELVNEIFYEFNDQIFQDFIHSTTFQPFLAYTSQLVKSVEGYSSLTHFSDVFEKKFEEIQSEILLHDSTNLIMKNDDNEIIFVTLRPMEKAAQANGYLWFEMRDDTYYPVFDNWITATIVRKK